MYDYLFKGEMTLLQARVEMYFRFVRKRCAADIEVDINRYNKILVNIFQSNPKTNK